MRIGRVDLSELSETLRQRRLDGWLVFDFKGVNPVAARLLEPQGMLTRRLFVWLPAVGEPVLLVHLIDQPALEGFPGRVTVYQTWQELQKALTSIVRGRRVALEISPENAVPYVDRVPNGVVELLERIGARVVSSAHLISRFAARWSPEELADHRRAAETLAEIARTILGRVVREPGLATETGVRQEVVSAIHRAGLVQTEPPLVAFGPNAADPHYAPQPGGERRLQRGEVVLLDLWARCSARSVWADQTWMGFAGERPAGDVEAAWNAVRDARDAVVERLRTAARRGEPLTGADLDQVARSLLTQRGYGPAFGHRTGHSIEAELHGMGPNLDDFETHDTREILPGVGFSVEPGIYLTGKFGVRSEINVMYDEAGPVVTPEEPQRELITSA